MVVKQTILAHQVAAYSHGLRTCCYGVNGVTRCDRGEQCDRGEWCDSL